ncbi:MAG: alpha/beta hydrolase [Actinomycetia bacterium]|nr:alpha/beta hydrolase [Actinomycetes bacterium]
MDDVVSAMLRRLDAEFPVVERMTAVEARAAVAARRQPDPNPDEVEEITDREIDGPGGQISVRIYRPHRRAGAAVVFYHGGGFVFCDIDSHDGFCRAMARHTSSVVVSVGYRLAPEHPAPAAAEDALTAFRWAVEHAAEWDFDPGRVAVAGDSAGGNLAAVTVIQCRDLGGPMPAAQVLLYPVIDPSFDTESYQSRATGYFNTRAAMQWYWFQYLGGSALPEPSWLVAPARAESHVGLPPALVVTAELDPLHSEAQAYARRLRAAGVPVVHRDFPGLFHGFLTMMPFVPGAAARELLWTDLRELLITAPLTTRQAR